MKKIPLEYRIFNSSSTGKQYIDFILPIKFTHGKEHQIFLTEFDEDLQEYYINLISYGFKPYFTLKETKLPSRTIRQKNLLFEKENQKIENLITQNTKIHKEPEQYKNWGYILQLFNINPKDDKTYLWMENKIKQGKHFNEI